MDATISTLRVFKREIRRKIYGPLQAGDNFLISTNHELYELLNIIHRMSDLSFGRRKMIRSNGFPNAKIRGHRRGVCVRLYLKGQVEKSLRLLV